MHSMIYSQMLRNGIVDGNNEFQNMEANAKISRPRKVKITKQTEIIKYETPRTALT